MNVFVGYHYRAGDAWLRELILPLIRAFEFEVQTGEDTYGATFSGRVGVANSSRCGVVFVDESAKEVVAA